jgi:hypothetical protein
MRVEPNPGMLESERIKAVCRGQVVLSVVQEPLLMRAILDM